MCSLTFNMKTRLIIKKLPFALLTVKTKRQNGLFDEEVCLV